jgi:hypothetical protein
MFEGTSNLWEGVDNTSKLSNKVEPKKNKILTIEHEIEYHHCVIPWNQKLESPWNDFPSQKLLLWFHNIETSTLFPNFENLKIITNIKIL